MLGCLGKVPPDRSLFDMSDYIIQQVGAYISHKKDEIPDFGNIENCRSVLMGHVGINSLARGKPRGQSRQQF